MYASRACCCPICDENAHAASGESMIVPVVPLSASVNRPVPPLLLLPPPELPPEPLDVLSSPPLLFPPPGVSLPPSVVFDFDPHAAIGPATRSPSKRARRNVNLKVVGRLLTEQL